MFGRLPGNGPMINNVGLDVLFASNGNEFSLQAANHLRQIVLPRTRRLTVLAVAPLGGAPARLMRNTAQQREEDLQEARQAATYTLGFITEPDNRVTTRARWGVPQDEILAEAAQTSPDLLVLGRREPNPLVDLISTGTALSVLARAQQPVFIAREPAAGRPVVAVPFLDASGFASATGWLQRLAFPADTRVVLIGSLEPIPVVPGLLPTYREHVQSARRGVQQAQLALLRSTLGRAAMELEQAGFDVSIAIREERITRSIASGVEHDDATIVFVGMSKLTTEPVREEFLRACGQLACSVLVTRGA